MQLNKSNFDMLLSGSSNTAVEKTVYWWPTLPNDGRITWIFLCTMGWNCRLCCYERSRHWEVCMCENDSFRSSMWISSGNVCSLYWNETFSGDDLIVLIFSYCFVFYVVSCFWNANHYSFTCFSVTSYTVRWIARCSAHCPVTCPTWLRPTNCWVSCVTSQIYFTLQSSWLIFIKCVS